MERFHTKHKGSVLLEAMFAIAIFGVMVLAIVTGLITAEQASNEAALKDGALRIAEDTVAIIANLRDEDYDQLVSGTYGLQLVSNRWELISSPDVIDEYTRTVTITDEANGTKRVSTELAYETTQGTKTLTFATTMGEWENLFTQGDNLNWLIDTHTVVEIGDGRTALQNIMIFNSGPIPVVIDKMYWDWDKSGNNERVLEEVWIDDERVWDYVAGDPVGKQEPPTTLDIEDVIIFPDNQITITNVRYDKNIMNHDFTIGLLLKDGSESQASFHTLPNYN